LNPFDYFIDKLTFERGNPYLNPQFSMNSLNYTLMQRYNVTLGINDVRDAIVESMGQDSVLKQTWVIRENLGKEFDCLSESEHPDYGIQDLEHE
jgi:hypothetical protein